MRIGFGTNLGEELHDKLHKIYCDKCEKSHSGMPGCCVGCITLLDIDIIKDPTKFEELNDD